jgi:glycerol-3-phosphate O-acyltransferase / dihydroxyacetone phosphate acyltransferase
MIYQLLKPFVRILFHFYFRKIYFNGVERIPKDRAVLFAVNHPTAFLDPVFVASHIRPTTHFLLRGDVFVGKLVIWLLNQINTIPVFRFRDGFSNLKNNQDTFEKCYDLLGNGNHVLVLAEGHMEHEKRLRPIQKGTARLMLGAYDKYPNGKYCILPIGVNYTAANELRSEMMTTIGRPILLEDYLDAYKENPRKAVKQITDEITRQLEELVVHIQIDEDADFVNNILTYKRNDRNKSLFPYRSDSQQPVREEVHIANTVNNSSSADKQYISQLVTSYESLLRKHSMTDFGVAQPDFYQPFYSLLLFLLAPLAAIGYGLFYAIPFGIGKYVAHKKVRKPAFYGSIVFGVALAFYLLPTIVLLIVTLLTLSWKTGVGIVLFYALCYLGVHYRDYYYCHCESKAWSALDKAAQEELRRVRQEIIKGF